MNWFQFPVYESPPSVLLSLHRTLLSGCNSPYCIWKQTISNTVSDSWPRYSLLDLRFCVSFKWFILFSDFLEPLAWRYERLTKYCFVAFVCLDDLLAFLVFPAKSKLQCVRGEESRKLTGWRPKMPFLMCPSSAWPPEGLGSGCSGFFPEWPWSFRNLQGFFWNKYEQYRYS